MTATETGVRTLTVPAPKIEVGDVIGGRVVRSVTGRKPQRTSADYFSMSPNKANSMGAISFAGHVVCAGFEDGGAFGHYWGTQSVEVERRPHAGTPPDPPRVGISAVREAGSRDLNGRERPGPITGWRWVAFTGGGAVRRGEEDTRALALDAAERAARDE